MDTALEESSEQRELRIDNITNVPGFAQVVYGVLTQEECSKCIEVAEASGFARAAFFTDNSGTNHYSDIRKSERCIIDSVPFVKVLWNRLLSCIPEQMLDGDTVFTRKCINERLRILKYSNAGDEFKHHTDGAYVDSEGAQSRITILIYLNDTYKGAYTSLHCPGGPDISLIPQTGSVFLMEQRLMHYVPALIEGTKYVMRTEIMYECKRPVSQNEIKVVKLN